MGVASVASATVISQGILFTGAIIFIVTFPEQNLYFNEIFLVFIHITFSISSVSCNHQKS